MKRYPAEALQPPDHRRNVRKQCELLDLAIQLVTPLELVEQ